MRRAIDYITNFHCILMLIVRSQPIYNNLILAARVRKDSTKICLDRFIFVIGDSAKLLELTYKPFVFKRYICYMQDSIKSMEFRCKLQITFNNVITAYTQSKLSEGYMRPTH
jgi:hypothetical protein